MQTKEADSMSNIIAEHKNQGVPLHSERDALHHIRNYPIFRVEFDGKFGYNTDEGS